MHFLNVLVDPLPLSSKDKLDALGTAMFSGNNRRGVGRLDYPRISFSGKFTSLSLLSADEKVGKLLLIYTLCQTEEGREVFIQRCYQNFDAEREARAKQMRKKDRCTPAIVVDPTLLPPEELPDTTANTKISILWQLSPVWAHTTIFQQKS